MTDTPQQPDPPALESEITDLRDTPLADLVRDPGAGAFPVAERVLESQAGGLLTVASFNASI